MKRKHKSIFGKLIFSYIVFTLVAVVGIVFFFVLALLQSVDLQSKDPEYPYISFDENGELREYEQLDSFGGWVEELDENYAVVNSFGEKKTEQMSYTEKEIISYFDKSMRPNGVGEYRVFYHETDDYRYLIFFPNGLFQIVFNINNNGMVYTSFNKVILVGLLVFLGLEVLGISLYISRRITKPMTSISEGMAKVAAGETNVNIPIYEEKEFVEIQDAFVKMQDALYRQKAEKEDILNKRHQMLLELSHDIKTPVSTIKSYATALSENMVPNEELPKYYSTISRKADRVNDLTMDLFTMLKMESEEYQVTKEKLNFSETVRTILANLYEDITAEGYDLDIDMPEEDIYTLGDENYLTRAVENLLNNARKYNTSGNKIAVRLTKVENLLSLKVMDDGTQIDEETRKNMFLAFARGEKSRSSDGGTGLGLAITKQIVVKHGGELDYKYQDDMNCFEMILPVN